MAILENAYYIFCKIGVLEMTLYSLYTKKTLQNVILGNVKIKKKYRSTERKVPCGVRACRMGKKPIFK